MKNKKDNYKEFPSKEIPDCCIVCRKVTFTYGKDLLCTIDKLLVKINGICNKFDRIDNE